MRANSITTHSDGMMCVMVPFIEYSCTMHEVGHPRRACKARPGRSQRNHLPSSIASKTQDLGGGSRLGHEGPVRTFPLASYAGRECVVPIDLDDLSVLISPVTRGRAALAGLPGSIGAEWSVPVAVDVDHLLS